MTSKDSQTRASGEEDSEVAAQHARATYEEILSRLPPALRQKEEELFAWYLRHKGNPLTKLQALYSFMASLFGAIETHTPCRKGCSACCHYPVSVSELEIAFIEKTTGIRRKKGVAGGNPAHGTPCPFLRNGSCSIYAARPFVCRKHITLTKTAYWCDPARANLNAFPMLRFSEVERVFQAIRAEAGESSVCDIREVFGTDER